MKHTVFKGEGGKGGGDKGFTKTSSLDDWEKGKALCHLSERREGKGGGRLTRPTPTTAKSGGVGMQGDRSKLYISIQEGGKRRP